MGCAVLRADVRLQFNDPTDAPGTVGVAGLPVADEARPKECGGRFERWPPDERVGFVQREMR